MATDRDAHYMGLALAQARLAARRGEVPVGAVLVRSGPGGDEVLAEAHNQPIARCDPTAHAEMLALRQAAERLGNYRLDGCELYVTLEPCAMCAQALLHARVARVVYGAAEPKTGAAGSVLDLFAMPQLNYQTAVQAGVMAEAATEVLQAFFAQRRAAAKAAATPVRQDALRTPDPAFAPLWQALPHLQPHSQRWQAWPHLEGLQLHALDLPASAPKRGVVLALHSPTAWCAQWAAWAIDGAARGERVFVPDLIGFGLSDKPKRAAWHTLDRHARCLIDTLTALGVPAWRVVATPDQVRLAERLQALAPQAVQGLSYLDPIAPDFPPGWRDWPYPDAGHRAGPRAWRRLPD